MRTSCLLFALALFVSACSTADRTPSAHERRGQKSVRSELSFTGYFSFTPSRKRGGEWIEIQFNEPKSLTEFVFEFINYPVKVYEVQVSTTSGHVLPIPALADKFVRGESPYISFEGLSPELKIEKLRFRAEGFEHSDASLTLALFSPDGFSKSEVQKNQGLKRVVMKEQVDHERENIPSCYQRDPSLREYFFNFDELGGEMASRHYCQKFVPEFRAFLRQHPHEADFLKTGVKGVKPLIVVSQRFAYDSEYHELFVPLHWTKREYGEWMKLVKTGRAALEGANQEQENIALGLDYENYMESFSSPSRLSYADEMGVESSEMPPEYCRENFEARGLSRVYASRLCQQVVGFEQQHFQCLEALTENHFPLSAAHSSCVEARGKWMSYLPCVSKLSDLDVSHYDAHQFCVRTPVDYLADQTQCVERLKSRELSSYQSLQTCQRHWGKETELFQCLDQRAPASGVEQALARCAR